ncbi:MAG: DoxX family protein [Pyrinomonadaceae bacterium]
MFRRLIETAAVWFPLPVRLALGAVFIGHGAQKVFGVWGGKGLAAFAAAPQAPMGLRPVWLWMGAAALAELVGGVLVLLGLLTRVGAFMLACVMFVAMVGVHWGAFFMPTGIEYTVALMGMAVALLISGGGQLSADAALQGPRAFGAGRRR